MKFTGERMIPDENRQDVMYVEHLNRYMMASGMTKDKVVLDIASGSGYGSDILLKAGAKQVVGVDISNEAVKYSKKAYPNIDFIVGSVANIPLGDNSVDVIVSFETIEHVDEKTQEKFLKEVKRVLKSDGILIVSTPNSLVYPKGNPYHIREFTIKEFEKFLKRSFSNVEMLFQESAESNFVLPEKVLAESGLTDHLKSSKINKLDPCDSEYVVAVCSDSKVNLGGVGQTILFDSLPRKKYQIYNKKIRELNQNIKKFRMETATQKRIVRKQEQQLVDISNHLKRLYDHPSYIIKHWIKQAIKKILPDFVIERIVRRRTGKVYIKKPQLFYKRIVFKKLEKPTVSIIIPVFNKWEYTYDCLKSIHENCKKDVDYEIIVVDNASSDGTERQVENIQNITYIRNKKNIGFGEACNQGAKKARGKYIVFLNNDTEVSNNWLSALIDTFKQHKNIGMVGSKLVYPDGRLQEAGGVVWQNKSAYNYGNMGDPSSYEFNYFKDVDYCSGASVMIGADVFKKLKGFDSIFAPAYYEDTDLAFRVRQMGLRTVYQPLSVLTHYEGATAGRDITKGLKKYQEVNQKKFFKRWAATLQRENGKNMNDVFLARDRSIGKKVLLYMDYRIPTYDQDAGAFITLEYLKIFKELGYKIIFWPHDQVKIEPYATKLQHMGIEVVYGGVDFDDFILENGDHIDITVLSRPTVAEAFGDIVRENTESKIIYVAHDLHYLRESRSAEIKGNKKEMETALKTKKMEMEAMRKAGVSLFFSDQEVEIIVKEDQNIKTDIMPWIENVPSKDKETPAFSEREGLLFLGGFDHLPNPDAVLWFHEKILPLVKQEIKDIKVYIAGSKPNDTIRALDSDNFKILGFVEDDEMGAIFASSKVFIAPLRYGAGFKGKIAKAMSYGLPVVTTGIGSEGIGLIDGENAMIADSEKDFARKIVKLYKDEKTWKKISENSVQHVREKYSPENAKEKIKKIISEL